MDHDAGSTRELQQHPLGTLLPPLSQAAYAQLKTDLEKNGQVRPIEMFEGKVLDGWHRYRALRELGKPVNATMYLGDPFKLLSADLVRRHVPAGERAHIYARMNEEKIKRERAAAKERKAHSRSVNRGTNSGTTIKTHEKLAKEIGVSKNTMVAALTVVEKGTPEQNVKVATGDVSVQRMAREIAKSPKTSAPESRLDAKLRPIAVDLHTRLGALGFRRLIQIMRELIGPQA